MAMVIFFARIVYNAKMKILKVLFLLSLLFFLFPYQGRTEKKTFKPFVIHVTDKASGRGIPLAELSLENGLRLISDNDGFITLFAPDLLGLSVRFKVSGHGYSTGKKDFWGDESLSVTISEGGFHELELSRLQPAERLYRITGAGRFNHTILSGRQPSFLGRASLPGQVIGQDSLICLPWNNQIWNFYGDTLGLKGFNFSAACATIPLPEKNEYDPELGIPLKYMVDESGFARKMIETGKKGFTWIEYVVPVKFGTSRMKESLIAKYVLHSSLEKVEESGFAVFNQGRGNFSIIKRFKSARPHKCTHPFPVDFNGKKQFFLFPWEMTSTGLSKLMDEKQHLFYSPLIEVAGERNHHSDDTFSWENRNYKIRRDKFGKAAYEWQPGSLAVSTKVQSELLKQKLLRPEEALFAPIELSSGKRVYNFNGSIAFNPWKGRWIMINQGNKAGEIIYSEADTPTGPWSFARKVSWFKNYNLYNPVLHPWFFKDNGRVILFEGTYTNYFSASPGKSPEADYNQVMFRLDLSQSQLIMPIPIYRVNVTKNKVRLFDGETLYKEGLWGQVEGIEFFAFSKHEKHPDLTGALDKAGQPLPFKLLAETPKTTWGKSWLKDELKQYLRFYGLRADSKSGFILSNQSKKFAIIGRVLQLKVGALNFSPEISFLSWKDFGEKK